MGVKRLCEEDRSLLQRTQRGDDRAIASLYDRYASLVYSIALRVLREPTLAEQVLSEIFIEIWRSPASFMEIEGSFGPSMAMIARDRAVAMLLHKPECDLDFPFSHRVTNQPDRTREGACAAMDALPGERRLMLERAFFHGMTQAEFAALTKGLPETEEQLALCGAASHLADTGLEVIDLHSDPAFARRRLHVRDAVSHIEAMNRLAGAFVESPTNILQELVTAAVELCGADSAGISVEQKGSTDDDYYHWVATAGQYSGFLNAKLPRYPSACGLTLERGRPQIFRVRQRFFDLMGIQAPTVTDGMLFPWRVEETRGTIWIMAHSRQQAFDGEDCRMMQALASFAATGVKLQRQQKVLMEQARAEAETAMANNLAHEINNPLQGLMQTVFLFGRAGSEANVFAQQAMGDVLRLRDLVKQLLSTHE